MDMDHDHNHGDGDGGMSGERTCPMIMVFHGGHCERILWRGWVAYTVTEFVLSAVAIFAIAFLYEALKFLREFLLRHEACKEAQRMAQELSRKTHNENNCNSEDLSNPPLSEIKEKTYFQRIFGWMHLIQSLLNFVQVIIAYLLMLIFMNYNYWLCLAVVLGFSLGYFFFGWIKPDPRESECCP